jgi:hypothetical protein
MILKVFVNIFILSILNPLNKESPLVKPLYGTGCPGSRDPGDPARCGCPRGTWRDPQDDLTLSKIGEIPDAWGSASVPYRFYPLISGSGGTGALKRFVPTGSITEECSRANPGGWGLSTESLLYWKRPPCIATTVSSPKGQGRIQFRRGTTADPDPVEYLLRLTILIYWRGKNFYELAKKD